MKVISMNIQGGKKKEAVELIYLKSKFKPDITFVLETLTNARHNSTILRALPFENKIVIDPTNHCGGGGLWVLWNNDNIIVLNNKETTNRCVLLNITHKVSNTNILISGLYAPAQERDKPAFWEYLN